MLAKQRLLPLCNYSNSLYFYLISTKSGLIFDNPTNPCDSTPTLQATETDNAQGNPPQNSRRNICGNRRAAQAERAAVPLRV